MPQQLKKLEENISVHLGLIKFKTFLCMLDLMLKQSNFTQECGHGYLLKTKLYSGGDIVLALDWPRIP
jgi:hypothetical protein